MCTSQLIQLARVCSHLDDFNARNKCLTAKLLKQGYRYYKLRSSIAITKNLFQNSVSFTSRPIESEFYGDIQFKKIMGRTDFPDQFQKVIICQKRIGYNLNVM